MKRRAAILILCCLLVLGCTVTARAESAASAIQSYSTVASDGECKVTLTVTFRLEEAMERIAFPLPREARDIKKDGSTVSTRRTADVTEVDLSDYIGNLVGTFTMRFEYTLPAVVKNVEGNLILELPLLSGFALPIEQMEFTITLPGQIDNIRPNFSSIYYQDAAESHMTFATDGNMISGRTTSLMEDHEAMSMTLDVPEEMFPSISTYHRTGNPEIIPMCICAVLALVYWLLFLRTMPVLPFDHKTAPEGVTAGELGCRLTLSGADLTMLVFSWAQMGYILIQLDDRGRVILHKRMEMGNERSLFEVRMFRSLFGKRIAVEATGYGFARLARQTAAMIPGERSMLLHASGNMKIFRCICCAIQIFCGICMAMNISSLALLQVLLSILLSIVGVVAGWLIQDGMYHIHLRQRLPKVLALAAFAVWLIVGLIAGQIVIALMCALAQVLAGFAAAYGGRRSEVGRQCVGQILGLRKFLRSPDKEELLRLRRNDPEYFYNMAPYALALGVGKQFASHFGRKPLPPCPYLMTNIQGRLSAEDWMLIMRETVRAMDTIKRRMDLEKWAIIKVR